MIITHVFKFDAFLVFHVVCFTNLNPSVLRLSHRLARTHLLHVRCVITCLIYQLNVYKLVLLITWRTHWRRSSHYTCFAHASGALAGVGSVHMPSAYNMIGYPSTTQSHGSFDGRYANETTSIPKLSNSPAPHASQNACPTLFVANLGPTCTEQELIQVFSRYPGFLKLKMQSTYGSPVAFVDFQDTASSAGALHHLQGMILYSSVAGEGMRLEYAKSRMGMRRKQT